jgi:hypothetical protein
MIIICKSNKNLYEKGLLKFKSLDSGFSLTGFVKVFLTNKFVRPDVDNT